MAAVQSIELITTDPKVRRGRPCVGGSGIKVTDIVMASLFHGRSPDQISSDYALSLAQVHAALAYYYQHKDELDRDIREQITAAKAAKEQRIGGEASLLP
ncbi:MAG: DUF433 domain-containing protein [Chloroflexota bacterium]|jgi:uncharacterized protein (DUF433 family)|nr:DUF433 domain-containing protein [Chloroflexota bacterium]